MAYSYDRRSAKTLALSEWDLEGMTEGRPVRLYHGTTRSFRTFSVERSRTELVEQFYGAGIFLTPSKRVAEKYAEANRNIGFNPEVISDLKQRNPNAGAFLQALYDHGKDGWETYWKDHGFWHEDAPPGEPKLDLPGFEKHLGGIDPNTLGDIAGYIIGSKTKPLGTDDGGTIDIFNTSTGAPDWLYNDLDAVGLDSSVYRPKSIRWRSLWSTRWSRRANLRLGQLGQRALTRWSTTGRIWFKGCQKSRYSTLGT